MVKTGLDRFEREWPKALQGARAGLLVHPASVNRALVHAADLLLKSRKVKLTALFGPQHGILGETQDNMVEWSGFRDRKTGLQAYSLYGTTRKPTAAMLKDIDVLIVDLQDVGSRYYTFIWTMELCMQACLERGKALVVLDRPNPVNGKQVEGPVLDMRFASFVGQRPLPVRHGMTMGEIGHYLKTEFYPPADFHVIPVQGWPRDRWFDGTGLPWVLPSPNMPTLETAAVYPGMCLLEGTNVSEGRGTTRPFEIFGAPFIDPDMLVARLRESGLAGVRFRPLSFLPTFQKHAGKLCGGAQIHVTDRTRFRPFKTGAAVVKAVHDLYPRRFRWKKPPYEYEGKKMPIDILTGSDRFRNDIEKGTPLHKMEERWNEELSRFQIQVRRNYLIYR